MLPKYLKIKGFRSYIDTEIDFAQFGDMFCVIGQNGAGKSSIIEMITTALYWVNSCTDSKGAGMDECINSDCDHFEIEFCFVMNGIEYIIKTTKYRGESRELEFYIDGVNQSEKVTETQEKINNVLKMDYDTFLDTVCIGQGKSSRFMSKKPAERKQTLMQILDVQKYEQYEKLAKEKKKAIKEQMDAIDYKIDLIGNNEINEDEVKSTIANNEIEISAHKKSVEKLKKQLEQELEEKAKYKSIIELNNNAKMSQASANRNYENLLSKLNNAKQKKEEMGNSAMPNVEAYKEDILKYKQQYEDNETKLNELKEKIHNLKTQAQIHQNYINDYRKQFEDFKSYDKAICELCGNEITESHKESHLRKIKAQAKEHSIKKKEFLAQAETLAEDVNLMTTQNNEYRHKIDFGKEQIHQAQLQKSKYDDIINMFNSLNEMFEEAKKQKEQADKMEILNIEEKQFNDDEIRHKITAEESEMLTLVSENARLQESINNYNQNKLQLEELQKEYAVLKQKHTDLTAVATAFGKSGIPASIIAHDIPEMEAETNKILKVISNDTMSIQFITTKQTAKGKKTTDTLEIVVNDTNGARAYETYSGGEKFRIDFACHIGMAKFLTKRAGASIDFLIIDEGLGSQDDFAKQKFIESINALKGLFKQIMVITHIQDLQNAFDKRVLVEKDQLNGSKVEIIS